MKGLLKNGNFPIVVVHKKIWKHDNELYAKLSHFSEAMTWVTGDAMNLIAAGEFQLCKDCDLDEEKQTNVSE